MSPEEVIDLLSVVVAYDHRTVGDGDVEAWRLALDDPTVPNIGLEECVDAVVVHYRATRDWIGPSDILKRLKSQRADALHRALPPAAPSPGAYAKVKQLLDGRQQRARAECAANRTAVLAHEDLAAELTEPPIGYKQPDQWNGVIPPEQWREQHNNCPRRAALVALVDEARAREAKSA